MIDAWGLLSEHFEQTGVKGSGYGPLGRPQAFEEVQTIRVYAEQGLTVAGH